MNVNLHFFLIVFYCCNSLQSQSFVNNSNKWYLDDCYSSFVDGSVTCTTYEYEFENSIVIDSLEYMELLTDNQNPAFPIAVYYREECGRIYGRETMNTSEFLIYDFTAQVGDQIEIGGSIFGFWVEVLSIDSIALNSGEKRKRLEVGLTSNQEIKTYWIEGIGGELSPLDSRYMFTADAWIELNCYFVNSAVEYSLKDCNLTSFTNSIVEESKLIVYPNPANTNKIYIESSQLDKIVFIDIFDYQSKLVLNKKGLESQELNTKDLPFGLYLIRVFYEGGNYQFIQFLKE